MWGTSSRHFENLGLERESWQVNMQPITLLHGGSRLDLRTIHQHRTRIAGLLGDRSLFDDSGELEEKIQAHQGAVTTTEALPRNDSGVIVWPRRASVA